MIRLAIVDDHALVRAGFREMLQSEPDLHIEFEAASAEEALQKITDCACELVLLDLSLPGQSGADVLRVIRQRFPQLRVLVVSTFSEDRYAVSMIRHGASGYLCKNCEPEELIQAIRTVAQGRRYVSGKTAELLANDIAGEGVKPAHELLSDRELQVFIRLAKGQAVGDIAASLNLSVKTVSTYRTRVLEKLGVSSNAELATYAHTHGLLMTH